MKRKFCLQQILQPFQSLNRALHCSWFSFRRLFILGIAVALLTAIPVRAAEKIYFSYGILGRSISLLQIYLNDRTEYQAYLQPFYLRTLTDPPFEFSVIRSLTGDQLAEMIHQSKQ